MSPGRRIAEENARFALQLRPLRVAKLVIIVVQTPLRSGV